jgi:hypothetical protein
VDLSVVLFSSKEIGVPHPTILVTHSLRSYREAVAAWLRGQRPALSVVECEPEALDVARTRYDPCLIICEAPTPSMRRNRTSLSWIQFCPAGSSISLVHVGMEERSIQDLHLSDILWIVDVAQAKAMLQAGPQSGASSA